MSIKNRHVSCRCVKCDSSEVNLTSEESTPSFSIIILLDSFVILNLSRSLAYSCFLIYLKVEANFPQDGAHAHRELRKRPLLQHQVGLWAKALFGIIFNLRHKVEDHETRRAIGIDKKTKIEKKEKQKLSVAHNERQRKKESTKEICWDETSLARFEFHDRSFNVHL
jgi:hypothetical protein